MRKISLFPLLFVFVTLACGAAAPTAVPTPVPPDATATPIPPTVTPTKILPTLANLPQTEADVPRISAASAKAAFDSGAAIILDVRNMAAYAETHIAGALNIPLANIELDPADISLKKDRWIITYCT